MHSLGVSTEVGALSGLKLLVLDDDRDCLELTALLFEAEGVEVRTAASASEALKLLNSFPLDVIISDISMPDEDGFSFLGRVKKFEIELGRKVPAIAVTALAREEDRTQALATGFDAYLVKPVDLDELVKVVMNLSKRGLSL